MDINQVITGELGVKRWQVDAAVKLIDEGNTIPFIARYRKEVTEHWTMNSFVNCIRPTWFICVIWKKRKNRYWQVSKNRENLRRTEKADSGSRDTGCGRRSVPPVSSETPDTCDDCKRKRTGTTGTLITLQKDKETARSGRRIC